MAKNKNKRRKITSEEEQLLIEQIKYLQNELVSIQQAFLGCISIPMGIYVLAIYYAFSSAAYSDVIFSILPFFFSLSFFNIIKYTIKMLGIDAYLCHLEKLINQNHNKNIFLWQNYLIYANGYSVVGVLCQVPAFLAIAVFIYAKFIQSVNSLNTLFSHADIVFIILLVVETIFLIIATLACAFQYHTVLKWCENIPFDINKNNKNMLSTLHCEIPIVFTNRK